MRVTWIQPEDLVPHALATARLDGHDVSGIEARWVAGGGTAAVPAKGASPERAPAPVRELAAVLLSELDALAALPRPGEPDALWELPDLGLPRETTFDRLHGAWLGRAAGCVLGKPVEGLPREGIEEIARATGNWPLKGWFTAHGLPEEIAARRPWNRRSKGTSLAENIDGAPEDDDLNYPLMAMLLLETRGTGFTAEDVALSWLDLLPAGRTFTAERVAYRNLLLGMVPPQTATTGNPFAEWIGAQIRTDLYGWARPGDVAAAASLAYRDAVVSHVRNGVYGAMFAAALGAAAVVVSTVDEVLDAGFAVLPPSSRIAVAVREARELAASEPDWNRVLDVLHARHGHLHWVHVLNNAALVTAALVHGGGDFAKTITATVTGGWDTDSNGATVGGIVGALTGACALPEYWKAPLKNRLATSIPGLDGVGFDELARRTLALAKVDA
ncbi:hypothetical protein Afil01_50120 [Actinorhabdospora filicis]|uniref:ADP-ribosylglycohydrolase n=1 Tax=Actinorhabdospora filicis TaxID=1785913 RepID=A0A9W6SQM7_9ACTN|nr:ADP-ribosylglycohydrolase family protein [Actinorhabdospora filicis]GLZ80205.1 hypothetical protein Afil01_50120 [Actinorhabdospora filicis]